MSATLNKITARAKQIRKKRPSMEWKNAIKQASAELRKSGAIGVAKKKAPAKKTRKQRPAKKQRRAKITKVTRFKKVTIGKTKRRRVGGVSNASLKGRLLENLKQQLGKLYVRYYMTQSIKETNKLSKQIAIVKKQIRQYQKSK